MNRAEYYAAHRALRLEINRAPPDASPWKQPLAASHHRDSVVEAKCALDKLTGNPPAWPYGRMRIEALIRAQASRNARRAALRALRDAGADGGELRHARNMMESYNWDPAGFMAKAAQLKEKAA